MNNRNRCASAIALDSCGCQNGTETLTTPLACNNRPGLPALSYRIGTHASFLETMKARLSSNAFPELKNLTARDSSDPSIALLDAWAMVADVLTFYQERIANEGYLRTATEERSIQELARLVGAGQRSGVAATVPLAYTIDPNTKGEVVIPAGSRVQSVPGQNEKPQTFETSEDLKAYAELNLLQPRMSRAQRTIIYEKNDKEEDIPVLYLKGVHTNLKSDDRMLIEVADDSSSKLSLEALYRVISVSLDSEANRTRVSLECEEGEVGQKKIIKVYAFRTKTAPFGHNAPLKPVGMLEEDKVMRYTEWQIDNPTLNPDDPKVDFIIVDKKKGREGMIKFDVINTSTGYFIKSVLSKHDKEKKETIIETKKANDRRFSVEVEDGYSISLELTGAFGKKEKSGNKEINIDQITSAVFSIEKDGENELNFILSYEQVKSGEQEQFEVIPINGNVNIIDIDKTNKRIKCTTEGAYSIERKITDSSGTLLSNCLKFINAYKKPIPSFKERVVSLEGNEVTVEFINNSTGKIDNVEWYFNKDSIESTDFHAYNKYINEPYKARLVLTGPGGKSELMISDDRPLILTFFTIEGELKKNQEINFSSKSTGSIRQEEWFFGDGSASAGRDGKNTYTSSGKYTVTLLVTRSQGETEQYTEFVDITD